MFTALNNDAFQHPDTLQNNTIINFSGSLLQWHQPQNLLITAKQELMIKEGKNKTFFSNLLDFRQ